MQNSTSSNFALDRALLSVIATVRVVLIRVVRNSLFYRKRANLYFDLDMNEFPCDFAANTDADLTTYQHLAGPVLVIISFPLVPPIFEGAHSEEYSVGITKSAN